MVMYGRNSESPDPGARRVDAGQCFDAALEAARIAIKYRTPVYLLSDAYLANGSEPWLLPDVARCRRSTPLCDRAEPRGRVHAVPARPEDARPPVGRAGDAGPRAPHRRAREGGRDREHLLRPRQPRPDGAAARRRSRGSRPTSPSSRSTIPTATPVLVLGWGGTFGPIAAGVRRVRKAGEGRARAPALPQPVPAQHGRGAAPLRQGADPGDEPRPAAEARARGFLVDAVGYNRVRGLPLRSSEVADAITTMLESEWAGREASGARRSPFGALFSFVLAVMWFAIGEWTWALIFLALAIVSFWLTVRRR